MPPLHLTDHEHVTITGESPEELVIDAHYLPSSAKPVAHLHPEQDERFEVHEGTLTARIDGTERTFAAGDRFEVPRGTVHSMWNAGDVPVNVTWRIAPALDSRGWFEALDSLNRAGRTNGAGAPRTLDMGPVLRRHRREFRLAGPPIVMDAAVAVLAAVGGVLRR